MRQLEQRISRDFPRYNRRAALGPGLLYLNRSGEMVTVFFGHNNILWNVEHIFLM